jgi:SAM-dependent methyltransferase
MSAAVSSPAPAPAEPAHQARERDLLVAFLGELRGRTVLDLGCTDPVLTGRLLEAGVVSYTGVAADERTAAPVRQVLGDRAGQVHVGELNMWSGVDGSARADVVVSRDALHRVRNLSRLLAAVQHDLAPGGRFVFTVPHPLVTAVAGSGHGRGWLRTADYLREGRRPDTDALPGPCWHRTTETYLGELRLNGLRLEEFAEGLAGMDHTTGPTGPGDGPRWAAFRCTRI